MTKKALIITGKLVQDHEYVYPYYRVQEAGMTVDVAVPGGEEVLGNIGVKVLTTMDTKDVLVSDYDLLIIPGGAKCMEYIRQDQQILGLIREFYEADKVIASICHAAQMLISAGIVKGKRISGYYSLKDDINNAGAIYTDEPCVVDGKIASTAHYKDMGPWMKGVLDLCGL